MDIRTHASIDKTLCGEAVEVLPEKAAVRMKVADCMRVDDTGLAHGGFLFGLADHAAMLAVNEPTVVLVEGSLKFLAPVVVGDEVLAVAQQKPVEGKRRVVDVEVRRGETVVASGTFSCAVPAHHVLRRPT